MSRREGRHLRTGRNPQARRPGVPGFGRPGLGDRPEGREAAQRLPSPDDEALEFPHARVIRRGFERHERVFERGGLERPDARVVDRRSAR